MLANFSPGPSALPAPVRLRIQAELDDWDGTGTSVMELSHRGPNFMRVAAASEERLRRLTGLPASTRVLFLQGGASAQFALVPLNLRKDDREAVYATDGHWGRKACREAALLRPCVGVPREAIEAPAASLEAAYVHVTSNETVDGMQWRDAPEVSELVACDLSSDICSGPLPLASYDVGYAGAQKNLGIAGVTVVLLSPRALEQCREDLPTQLSYRALAASGSMANTPPTFAWYVLDLVLQWIEEAGGLDAMEARNRRKASCLYDAIDASGFYRARVEPDRRSRMNVVFETPSAAQDARFVAEAAAAGFLGLKGHKAVGGLRASLYNAIELAQVEALAEFCREFERTA